MRSNRDLLTLIRTMQNFIPLDMDATHRDLNSIAGSVLYAAPETMGIWWQATAQSLAHLEHLEDRLWVRVVKAIWMNTRFEDIN